MNSRISLAAFGSRSVYRSFHTPMLMYGLHPRQPELSLTISAQNFFGLVLAEKEPFLRLWSLSQKHRFLGDCLVGWRTHSTFHLLDLSSGLFSCKRSWPINFWNITSYPLPTMNNFVRLSPVVFFSEH